MKLRSLLLPVLLAVGMSGCTSLPAVNASPAHYQIAPGATGLELTTRDNLKLFGQWWKPKDEPKAVVLLLHGMAAHAGFYYPWTNHLTGHGYAVFAYDQRGWGQSQGYGRRGYLRSYEDYVQDATLAYQEVKREYPDLPVFLQGESLGGAVAMQVDIQGQHQFQGLVLNAPGFKPGLSFLPGFLSDFGIWSGATLGKAWPNFPVVPMGNKMLFNQIGKLIIHDPAVKQRAVDDPHFTHSAVSAAFVTGLHAMSKNIQGNLDKVKTPFLIINGTRDTLVPYQSGDLLMVKAGATDKTRKLYEGMSHCTLHDHDKEKVWADILAWMDARLPKPVAMQPTTDSIVKAVMTEEAEPAL